jgi:myo-inositol-1(or 4)-monophosphatase
VPERALPEAVTSPRLFRRSPAAPSAMELEVISVRVGRMAAAMVAGGLGRSTRLRAKSSPTDIVTDVDEAAERAIREALEQETPGCGIVGEERGSTNATAPLQWIVDPLDGTVNFSCGVPLFSVSIAAAVGGEVVAAAVVDAVRGDSFSAVLGGGARRNDEPMEVSSCRDLSTALVATGFSYQPDHRAAQGRIVGELLPAAGDIRCFGSAALNLCWVAAGWVDCYFERDTKVWDYAAGALIAAEAGAVVELPCPENDGLTIAAPPSIFEPLRSLVEMPAP